MKEENFYDIRFSISVDILFWVLVHIVDRHFAERNLVNRHFADRHFTENTFRHRTDRCFGIHIKTLNNAKFLSLVC